MQIQLYSPIHNKQAPNRQLKSFKNAGINKNFDNTISFKAKPVKKESLIKTIWQKTKPAESKQAAKESPEEKQFKKTAAYKNLKKLLGSEADFKFYKQLEKAVLEHNEQDLNKNTYTYLFTQLSQPIEDNQKPMMNLMLSVILPEVIDKEKDLLRKEDLFFKLYNIENYCGGTEFSDFSFNVLVKIRDFYANNKDTEFKNKEKLQNQITKTLNAFIFNKFAIPAEFSEDEKIAFARKVINKKNAELLQCTPENIQYNHIIDGLLEAGQENKSEKFYKAAIDFAINQKAPAEAVNIIEQIENDKSLSSALRENLQKVKTDCQKILSDSNKYILNSIKNKSYKESLKEFLNDEDVKKAISKQADIEKIPANKIINKIKNGDYQTIYKTICFSIKDSKAEKMAAQGNDCALWENIIHYLDKIDTIVKPAKEQEFLKNIQIRAITAKICENRNKNPMVSESYREVLKTKLKEILWSQTEININNKEVLEILTTEIGNIKYYLRPEEIVFNSIDRMVDSNYYCNISKETNNELKKLRQEIKERLNLKSKDDINDDEEKKFWEKTREYFNQQNNSNKQETLKHQALDILNKYLEKNEKLTENSSDKEIKKAYRQLAISYHPDKFRSDEIFKEISNAYESLKAK